VLGKNGIIPDDLAGRMAKLAGFRNVLVHEYSGLDTQRVFKVLQDDAATLEVFRKAVTEFLVENRKTE